MADNTCHFGLNNMFADNGLSDGYATNLYFPADPLQMKACLETIFFNPGLRFVFSTRSKVPTILNNNGENTLAAITNLSPAKMKLSVKAPKVILSALAKPLYARWTRLNV